MLRHGNVKKLPQNRVRMSIPQSIAEREAPHQTLGAARANIPRKSLNLGCYTQLPEQNRQPKTKQKEKVKANKEMKNTKPKHLLVLV